jgi:hypothetical protein
MSAERTERERMVESAVRAARERSGGGDGSERIYRRRPYDRAFEPAIREGLLNARQATQRGNRQNYAVALARRYRLPIDLALQVTDNRIRVFEALRILDDRNAARTAALAPRRWVSPRLLLVAGFVAGVAVLGMAIQATILWNRHVDSARRLEQRSLTAAPRIEGSAPQGVDAGESASRQVQIRRDSAGRITLVTASKPEQVMATVCREALASGYCATLSIDQVMAEFPDAKIGRFTEVTDLEHTWIVHLRRDHTTGRWSAGNGHRPLQAVVDPASRQVR